MSASEYIETYGVPTYERFFRAAATRAQSRRTHTIAEHLAKVSLKDIITTALSAAAIEVPGNVAEHAIKGAMEGASFIAEHASTGAAGAGGALADHFGISVGIEGNVEGAVAAQADTSARASRKKAFSELTKEAEKFKEHAIRNFPHLVAKDIHAEIDPTDLEKKAKGKTTAAKIAKEAAHQADMLGRAWDQLFDLVKVTANAVPDNTYTPTSKWRKCRIAAEIAGGLAWFKRKYAKAFFIHGKLVEDYCEVGALFSIMETHVREISDEVATEALLLATRIGMMRANHMGDFSANRMEIIAEVKRREVGGVVRAQISAPAQGHLTQGTRNARADVS